METAIPSFFGPTTKQRIWLLQATNLHDRQRLRKNKAYKPTRTSETKKKQTYKSYRTYKPISIEPRASQPGGPKGASGFVWINWLHAHIRYDAISAYLLLLAERDHAVVSVDNEVRSICRSLRTPECGRNVAGDMEKASAPWKCQIVAAWECLEKGLGHILKRHETS